MVCCCCVEDYVAGGHLFLDDFFVVQGAQHGFDVLCLEFGSCGFATYEHGHDVVLLDKETKDLLSDESRADEEHRFTHCDD